MKTAQQILEDVERSYGCCGDYTAILVGNRVFSCDKVIKHRNDTIEFKNCSHVDESCYEPNGDYIGDILPGLTTFIFKDKYPAKRNAMFGLYETVFTEKQIIREIKQRKCFD